VPVVIYRASLLTELAARALLRTKRIALPNVLLGREAFAELLQRDVRTDRLAIALARALDERAPLLAACDEIETLLGPERSPSRLVARMLEPWLST
jgi:lipid A disaccharide synthetase